MTGRADAAGGAGDGQTEERPTMGMDLTRIHTDHAPTRLVFGVNAVGQVGAEVKALGATTALMVTDPGIESAGLLAPVVEALTAAGSGNDVVASWR